MRNADEELNARLILSRTVPLIPANAQFHFSTMNLVEGAKSVFNHFRSSPSQIPRSCNH